MQELVQQVKPAQTGGVALKAKGNVTFSQAGNGLYSLLDGELVKGMPSEAFHELACVLDMEDAKHVLGDMNTIIVMSPRKDLHLRGTTRMNNPADMMVLRSATLGDETEFHFIRNAAVVGSGFMARNRYDVVAGRLPQVDASDREYPAQPARERLGMPQMQLRMA